MGQPATNHGRWRRTRHLHVHRAAGALAGRDVLVAGGGRHDLGRRDGEGDAQLAERGFGGFLAAAQLIRFDTLGFAVSAGSACSSGTLKPSHVLEALAIPPAEAANVIRVSFGRSTTRAEVEAFGAAWQALAREARARAA